MWFLYLSSLEIVEFQNALTYCDTHHQIHRYLPVYFFDIALYTNRNFKVRLFLMFCVRIIHRSVRFRTCQSILISTNCSERLSLTLSTTFVPLLVQ